MSNHDPAGACGCCQPPGDRTPAPLDNPPGATAISYRVGTHGSFKATMLAHLADHPELDGLRTRADGDPAIALLDAWATTLDVLTFYQERIFTEGFIGTATEPRSLAELARTVGHRPAPGLAAGCLLAFTLEEAPTAPEVVTVEPGTRVQSLPVATEPPQTFETTAPLEARPPWNRLAAATSTPAPPGEGATELFLAGVAGDLTVGDQLLLISPERDLDHPSGPWALRTLTSVAPLPASNLTRVRWQDPLTSSEAPADPEGVQAHALRRAAVFGHNAPDWRTMPESVQDQYLGLAPSASVGTVAGGGKAIAVLAATGPGSELSDSVTGPGSIGTIDVTGETIRTQWPRFTVVPDGEPGDTADLDAVYPQVTAGGWVVLSKPGVTELYRVVSATTVARADFTLTGKVTRLKLDRADVDDNFDGDVRETVVLLAGAPLELAAAPRGEPVWGQRVDLAVPVPRLPAGRPLLVTGKPPRLRVAAGERGLVLTPDGGGAPLPLLPGEVLDVTAPPTDEGSDGSWLWAVRAADGTAGTVRGTAAKLQPHPAADGAAELAEEATTGEAGPADPQTVLELHGALLNAYDRASFRVAANVAPATHGETREQVLGSGDAAATLQAFTLDEAPLTYVRAATTSGSASTLEVRVGGVLWSEVGSLLDAGPRDRVYTTGSAEDGTVTVRFGDGVNGARLPTGRDNVTATYRVGTGLAGAVGAGRLMLLLDRPLGVRSVTNPLPAGLAADPEAPEATRAAVPRATLALERVVSLRDYQEAARSFAGIAKARAAWLWDGQTRLVQLTVAGAAGAAVDEASRASLAQALRDAGDPHQRLRVDGYLPAAFDLAVRVVTDPSHLPETVGEAVDAALRAAFSFEARDLGQPVTASEVAALAQSQPGVVGVVLEALHRHGEPATREAVLLAGLAKGSEPAELLTLDPEGLTVTTETP